MVSLRSASIIVLSVASILILPGCDNAPFSPKKANKNVLSKAAAPQEVASDTTSSPVANEPLPKNVLARVGGWRITSSEFAERLEGIKQVVKDFDEKSLEAKRMVLDELIRQQLLVHEARQQNLDQMKDIQDAVKDFENTLLVQELASKITKNIRATESDAREYYNSNPEIFVEPVQKNLREIVLSSQAEAKDILVQVLQGADFAQIARERSKSKSAANGGNLGLLVKAPFEQMQKAIEALKQGDVSAVFEGPEGYYIVKVDEVKGGEKKAFEDIKEDLLKGLTIQKQQQAILEKLTEISKKVEVQVNPDLLND